MPTSRVGAASSSASTPRVVGGAARLARHFVIVNGLVPAALLAWDAYRHQLGANGVNYAIHTTGMLGLLALILSLLVTPLRRLAHLPWLATTRRPLGLLGFGYIVLHLALFHAFDRGAILGSTLHEILTRRYLQVGAAALAMMVPLALTSTNAMARRLGARRWRRLHRLAYPAAIAGVAHYYLLVKSDVRQPLTFAAALSLLLGYRVAHRHACRRAAAAGRTATGGRAIDGEA